MSISPYFADLYANYEAELDDLSSDSEGKSALKKRLNEKRQEIEHILPMIEFAPEMVAVIFHNAFSFNNPKAMQSIVFSEPEGYGDDFISWDELSSHLSIASWADKLIDATLNTEGGDQFMVIAATLEFMRSIGTHTHYAQAEVSEHEEEDDEDGALQLDESGSDWLSEQGFESTEAENN
ncbi:hypothetical protein [Iodobacter fluviatilis]|uniref:Uncharacterized protein n=1 Tax=Iodobacter fluviatilis TaxID=537 RepID=A0A377SUF1_9NEIS|nr:hypothetical protein [Iodobacter fluviatilis]TCU88151.1 hypothetical protein EV682_104325 [Iodobacter fluviatilis]STR45652.1 Uncharacterised protein [Iodobacter fluviatilis]